MTEASNLADALSKAQGEFPTIPRNKEVTVTTKTGGKYKFKYATLETIFSATRPALTKYGLAINHKIRPTERGHEIVAVLKHKSGEVDECALPLSLAGSNQEQGSEITYKRRYAVQCVLGIAADDDDDANGADGNTIEDQRETNGKKFVKPTLAPSPAEQKAAELKKRYGEAKSRAEINQITSANLAHIEAMEETLKGEVRDAANAALKKFPQEKAAA
jgi:hypothetical protein